MGAITGCSMLRLLDTVSLLERTGGRQTNAGGS